MPITAFSTQAQRELDLEQWLTLNAYQPKDDPELLRMPPELRAKAARDIECSCCGARGALLVRGARSRGTGKAAAQGHFRFRADDGANPHHPSCDFFDEQKVRGTEYLVDFATEKSALTRAIRDLVCRGIGAGLFSQADIRSMRRWFLDEKAAHAIRLDVTSELLQWCVDMDAARWATPPRNVPFMPEHGSLPGFNWDLAAKVEWARRNEQLFTQVAFGVHFRCDTIERALQLVGRHGGEDVFDPSALGDKYEAACKLSSFAAQFLFEPGAKPLTIIRQHPTQWGIAGHALLALSALLLFVRDWDLQRASALYCRLKAIPPVLNGVDGNLIGLNPFHDYPTWQVINSARQVAAKRVDDRPVPNQIAELKAKIQAQYFDWAAKQ